MKIQVLAIAVAAGLLAGCGKREQASSKPATNTAPGGNPLTAPVDYVGAVGKAQKSAVRVVDTASINQAIQLFYAQEDRYPKDLNELVTEKYLPTLPAPPYGMKFDYDAKAGTIKVVKQ